MPDFVSTIPYDLLAVLTNEVPNMLKAVRLLRLLRLFKLASVLRGARFLQRWENRLNIPFAQVELVKIFVIIFASSHWMACLWGMTATSNPDRDESWFFLLSLDGVSVPHERMAHDPVGQYVASAYFAVMTLTTVGYGDIHPVTVLEHVVCIIFMLIGGVTWAYLIGLLTSIVTNLDRHGSRFKQVMDELNFMIADRGIPPELGLRVRMYWRAVQHLKRLETYDELSNLMSDQLQVSTHERGTR